MDTTLMPRERLATIVADAAARSVLDVTGFVNPQSQRMTWSEQGVHAAAFNAVLHDEAVTTALRMVKADGASEYESMRVLDPVAVRPEADISVPISTMMLMAGKSGDPEVILRVLRQAWVSIPTAGPSEKFDHERAFDDAIEEIRRRGLVEPRF